MNSKLTITLLAGTLAFSACDEKGTPYIEPEDTSTPEVVITRQMADSIWTKYLGTGIPQTSEAARPQRETEAYYEDYVENWILPTEETRDIVITFDHGKVSWTYPDEKNKKTEQAVKISAQGAHLTIRNEEVINGVAEGRARVNYILRGTSDDASVRIYSNKKFMITLDNAELLNSVGSVINVQKSLEKKRVFINVKENTRNYIGDATVYSDTIEGEDDKGAIFSEGKMIFMGKGLLQVEGNCNHAIASDDRIHIHSGVMIEVIHAAKDGIHAKDEVVISGGWTRSFANKDAIQSEALQMRGGCLMSAAKRAVSAPVFDYSGGTFCLVGKETDHPSATSTCAWDSIPATGYSILLAQ